jgi:hypothetical protein
MKVAAITAADVVRRIVIRSIKALPWLSTIDAGHSQWQLSPGLSGQDDIAVRNAFHPAVAYVTQSFNNRCSPEPCPCPGMKP